MRTGIIWKAVSVVVPILTGAFIVGISLVTASRVQSKDTNRIATRRLYLGKEILPDNLLYPLLMASDRVHLELAPAEEKIQLQVVYAQRRIDAASQLTHRGEHELALSTFTKAQKYLLQAIHGVEAQPVHESTRQLVRDAITEYVDDLQRCRQEHIDFNAPELDALTQELRSAGERLETK